VRGLAVLFLHLLVTVARLAGPGGARSVVAESVLVKHQLLVLNRCRKRSPNLCPSDRVVAGLCAVFIRPGRLIRSAIVFKPSTLLRLHRALVQRKYRRLFGSKEPMKPGPKGPGQEVIAAVVDMKPRNPSWGVHGSRRRSPWPSVFPSTGTWCDAFWRLGTSRNQTPRGRRG
jgi:putative transposase